MHADLLPLSQHDDTGVHIMTSNTVKLSCHKIINFLRIHEFLSYLSAKKYKKRLKKTR